jgi:hypothetical protein
LQVYPAINDLSDHDDQILILENVQIMMQNKYKYAFREINEEKITIFSIYFYK